MNKFNRAKDAYETAKTEMSNLISMTTVYSNAVVKLENALELIDINMSRAKANVTTLESKKTLVDSISAVNKTVENLQGVGDTKLSLNVEKLDDAAIRESIKLEALHDTVSTSMDKESAEAYLQGLK